MERRQQPKKAARYEPPAAASKSKKAKSAAADSSDASGDITPDAPYGINKRTGKTYVRKPYEKRAVGTAEALAAAAQA
eukprot:2904410-Pleurochrysis_carterae.AAC.1